MGIALIFGVGKKLIKRVLRSTYGLTASVVSGVISLTLNGRILADNGSLGSPSYSFANDPNTGLYTRSPNSDIIGFVSGGQLIAELQVSGLLLNAKVLGASSNISAAACDVSLRRVAAGVWAIGSGGDSGAGWLQNTAGRSRVANDVTNVTITPAAVTGLSATLIAGRKYSGKLVLFCSEATAADGLRLDFDGGTATMTSFIAQGWLSDDNGFQAIARSTALATDLTNTTITGSTVVEINFSLVCNAAGTFIPRFAKEADAAGAALTVSANSHMWIEDMP